MVVKPMIDAYDQYIPYPEYLKLLLRATDGTTSGMKDFSGYAQPVTNATGATGSTTQKKLNPYSMYFDGTDDYIYLNGSSDLAFGSDNFTISFWIRPNISTLTAKIYDSRPLSTSGYYPTILATNGILTYYTNTSNAITGTTTLSTNIWYHIALIKNSGYTKLYLNGIQEGSSYADTNTYLNGASRPTIGCAGYTIGTYVSGNMDELCVWKGIAIPINQLYPQTKPFSFRRA